MSAEGVSIFKNQFLPQLTNSTILRTDLWRRDNPGEYDRWVAYRDKVAAGQNPSPPAMGTKYGKALVAAARMAALEVAGGTDPYLPFG